MLVRGSVHQSPIRPGPKERTIFVPARTLLVVVATAVTLAAITAGATLAVTAGASSTTTTYYACLKSGALSNVGTIAPTCKSPATVISWNQTGPPGPAGNTVLNGAGAPTDHCRQGRGLLPRDLQLHHLRPGHPDL